MKDIIKEDKISYLVDNLVWLFAGAFVFYQTCFVPIRGFYNDESTYIYWGMVAVGTAIGILCTINRRRTLFTAFVNVVFPIQIYLLISTVKYLSPIFIVLLILSILLSLAYFYIVMTRKITCRKYKKAILFKRACFGILGARTVATVLLLTISVPMCISLGTGNGLISSDVDKGISHSDTEWTFENHGEELKLLDEDKWEKLDALEKLNVLATVKNIEMNEFGIPRDIKLEAKLLEENTYGSFDGTNMVIAIDIGHLESDSPEEVLNTVLHESMHAYQWMWEELYACVDDEYKNLKFIRKGEKYQEEYTGYIESEDNFDDYYYQYVEVEARNYAYDRVLDYYDYLYPNVSKDENGG